MPRTPHYGFSLAELLLAVAILGVLGLVAMPAYSSYVERTRVKHAMLEMQLLQTMIDSHYREHGDYPDTLAQIGAGDTFDPWGRRYVYLVFRTPADRGHARKDKNLVPINSEYDLYSMGKDGASQPPLLARRSRDDVVRANDGSFVGLASTYTQ